jgi:hypothetical protein
MMKGVSQMNRRTISLLLALLMIMGAVLPVGAQDGGVPDGGDATNRTFLPLVTQQTGKQQALTAVDGAIQSESNESLSKEQVSAARIINPEDLRPVSVIVVLEDSASLDAVAGSVGGQVVHRYEKIFKGGSMVLPTGQVSALQDNDGVKAVYLDELMQPDTEVTPGFIGATTAWDQLGGQDVAGEGVVVGVLDTGVWPEHPSVSDPDPLGKPYDPPPIVPGSNGFSGGAPRSTCDFGNTAYNPNDVAFTCNNKLIGAYSFIDTYKVVIGLLPAEFDSARDDNGHGTHTLTTAAGNGGVDASIFGVARGTVSGIAPRAHVIAYRVCGDQGCFQSDSAAAVEQAILDGVDSINFSISGGNNAFSDAVELAFLEAYDNGVHVAASAGNSGPALDTTNHRGPWTTTVAASTSNRHFLSTLTLAADNGDTLTLTGATVTDGIATPTLVELAGGNRLCQASMPAVTPGRIVICQRGVNARVEKSFNAMNKGAAGMILYNPALQGLNTDNHFIPSVHIDGPDGTQLLDFLASHTGVMASFTGGASSVVQGDVIASFSSRGGPNQTLGVSKPDITAPGVQILAGHTPMPATPLGGLPGQLFQSIQGTSMSSPHIAGVAAILADMHPDWTPGQIKSAIMLTAKTWGVVKENGSTPAGPFDTGSGRVDLTKAGDPGLSISETGANFVALQNSLWHANYPSLYVPSMPGKITVQRTAHSLHNMPRVWQIVVAETAPDLKVFVPSFLTVPANGNASFEIKLDATQVPVGQTRHARLELRSDSYRLTFPITIVRRNPPVSVAKTCTPSTLSRGGQTTCTITLANSGFGQAAVTMNDVIPPQLALVAGSVVGGVANGNTVSFNGMVAGANPPDVLATVDPLASPAGYFSIAPFSPIVVSAPGDETIHNFNVPAFPFAGKTWTRIGIVSNGYLVVGGGTGGDVNFINTNLPNAARPNNVLAPFWTDLNPGAGGRILVQIMTDGSDDWLVVEFENVPNFSNSAETNTFQVWIGLTGDDHPVEDISFTYGPNITDGDIGFLTVGAENEFGNRGQAVYFDGAGTPPAPSFPNGEYEVKVTSAPGTPAVPQVISFKASYVRRGGWTNCAEITSSGFDGAAVSCFNGVNR